MFFLKSEKNIKYVFSNTGGDTSPASPAGLTPMLLAHNSPPPPPPRTNSAYAVDSEKIRGSNPGGETRKEETGGLSELLLQLCSGPALIVDNELSQEPHATLSCPRVPLA